MPKTHTLLFTLLACLSLPIAFGCAPPPSRDGTAETTQDEAPADRSGVVGELTQQSGPGGVASPDLPQGTLLGKGAKLQAGQILETPGGTMVEVTLSDATTVRINEGTRLGLPGADHPGTLLLEGGEIDVIRSTSGEGIKIRAADETLELHSGEAHVRHEGERRHWAVVYGLARLDVGNETIELGPGASISTPLREGDPSHRPVVSLQPLEDTEWARSFDEAARLAASVPRGVGSLTARRAGESGERQRLRLVDQRVTVSISGRIAHTEIEQAFYNEAPVVLEGIYRFPLPADASISGLSLLVGNRWMDAEMLEKQRARRIFKEIVDATVPRDPALLHWEHGNIFKLRVFPIPGRGERRIRLSYTQVLPAVGDVLRYRYPMGGSGATEAPIDRFAFRVRIDGADLEDEQVDGIETPMLSLSRRDAGANVELETQIERYLPSYDVGVDIPMAESERRIHTETHLDRDGQAYFMAALRPELQGPEERAPVHYAFVLDRSHSITPELWAVARGIVQAMLGTLSVDDRFVVLACDTACDANPEGLQAANADSARRIEQFLGAQDLGGASDIGGMLSAGAASLRAKGGSESDPVIVYLGDGVPSSGELAPDKLRRLLVEPLRGARVQAVALGARADLLSLGAITRDTGGDLLQADARDDLDHLVRELRLRAQVPPARDVEIDLPEGLVDVHPRQISAVRPGESIVLVGKMRHPVHGEVRLRARGVDGAPMEEVFEVDLEADRQGAGSSHAHLPRTWARHQIDHLTLTAGHDAQRDIVAMSKAYTVLSRYTAMLVLENDAMYREFNVVRGADRTDKWTGKLGESGTKSEAIASEKPGTPGGAGAPYGSAGSKGEATRSTAAQEPGGAPLQPEEREIEDDRSRARDDAANRYYEEPRGAAPTDDEEPPAFDLDDDVPAAEERRPAPATRPRPNAPAKKSKRAPSADTLEDPFDDGGGGGIAGGGDFGGGAGRGAGGGGPWQQGPWHPAPRPRPRIRIQAASAPSQSTLDRIERLRRERDANSTRRSAHRNLVHAAIRAGHHEAAAFAEAWAAADPDYAPAMLALADMLAARGDPGASRAYASAIEVRPFSSKLHEKMAVAMSSKGDWTRACSHRRALMSIDPAQGDHHTALARCLWQAGDPAHARDALRDGALRARRGRAGIEKLLQEIDRGMAPPLPEVRLHGRADVRATLTWADSADLDLAVVDRRGQRLSALRPDRVRVKESPREEVLTLKRLQGSVFVEVTRMDSSGGEGPVRAELVIRTPHGSRTFPVSLERGTVRIARLRWSR